MSNSKILPQFTNQTLEAHILHPFMSLRLTALTCYFRYVMHKLGFPGDLHAQ